MTVGANYSIPVHVNGFLCKNCTDVDLAKKHIDPEHPRSGPFGINAKDDPTASKSAAVIFGGALNGLNKAAAQSSAVPAAGSPTNNSSNVTSGTQLDLLA